MSLFSGRSGPDRRESRAITGFPWGFDNDMNGGYASNDSGEPVTERSALRLTAVWACVSLISDLIAQMPVGVYRKQADGLDVQLPTPPIIADPGNLRAMSRRDWIGQMMVSVLLRGNAYALVTGRGANSVPTAAAVLHPDWVQVFEPYPLSTPSYFVLGDPVDATPGFGDLIILRGMTQPGWTWGLSPIAYMAQSIGTGLATQKFGAQWFGQGAHPSSIISVDHKLTDDGARTIKDRFVAAVSGRREPAVLGNGITYTPIQVPPAESQFLEAQGYTVGEIARIYRIPPEFLGVNPYGRGRGTMTYSNRDQRLMDLLVLTIQFWLAKLEDTLSALLPRGQFVRFDVDALLRSDVMSRYQRHAIGIQNHFESPNEARHDEGKPPIPELDDQWLAAPAAMPTAPPSPGHFPPKEEG